jgi:hypothetical protein
MTFRKSVAVRTAALDAEEAAIGASPLLRFYSGSAPANISDAATGTLLCEMALPADWMANASGGVKAKSGTWSGTGAAAALAGILAGYWRIYNNAGNAAHYEGSVGYTYDAAWAALTAYTAGQRIANGGKVYQCITSGSSGSSGGPTGTASDITDGTAHWAYIGAAGDMSVDNPVIAFGQTVTVTGFSVTAGNA